MARVAPGTASRSLANARIARSGHFSTGSRRATHTTRAPCGDSRGSPAAPSQSTTGLGIEKTLPHSSLQKGMSAGLRHTTASASSAQVSITSSMRGPSSLSRKYDAMLWLMYTSDASVASMARQSSMARSDT